MGIPEEPIARDEEDELKAASADKSGAMPAGEDEEKESGSGPELREEKKEPVAM
jgi:hypothetical protein